MNYDPIASLPFLHVLGAALVPVLVVLVVWIIAIKGFALWKAARNNHRAWFVVLLIVNTFGILELIYLFGFSKPKAQAPVVPSSPAV
jgi:hypothetical protein